MGQNRKDGQGSLGRIDFYGELLDDAKIEKLIGYRQVMVVVIIALLVIIRELLYPSHLYVTELFGLSS